MLSKQKNYLLILLLPLLVLMTGCREHMVKTDTPLKKAECVSGNCETGKGVIKFANGNRYVGEFKLGAPHGSGMIKYPNGDYFLGTFKYGKKHGIGEMHRGGKVTRISWYLGKEPDTAKREHEAQLYAQGVRGGLGFSFSDVLDFALKFTMVAAGEISKMDADDFTGQREFNKSFTQTGINSGNTFNKAYYEKMAKSSTNKQSNKSAGTKSSTSSPQAQKQTNTSKKVASLVLPKSSAGTKKKSKSPAKSKVSYISDKPGTRRYKLVHCTNGRVVTVSNDSRVEQKAVVFCSQPYSAKTASSNSSTRPPKSAGSESNEDAGNNGKEALAFCWQNKFDYWFCDGRIQKTNAGAKTVEKPLQQVGCAKYWKKVPWKEGTLYFCGYNLDHRRSTGRSTSNRDIREWRNIWLQ